MKRIALGLALTAASLPIAAQDATLDEIFPQATFGDEFIHQTPSATGQLLASFDKAFEKRTVTSTASTHGNTELLSLAFPQAVVGGEYTAMIAQARTRGAKIDPLAAVFPQASWSKIYALTSVFPQGNWGDEYRAMIAQANRKKIDSLAAATTGKTVSLSDIFPQASWGIENTAIIAHTRGAKNDPLLTVFPQVPYPEKG